MSKSIAELLYGSILVLVKNSSEPFKVPYEQRSRVSAIKKLVMWQRVLEIGQHGGGVRNILKAWVGRHLEKK